MSLGIATEARDCRLHKRGGSGPHFPSVVVVPGPSCTETGHIIAPLPRGPGSPAVPPTFLLGIRFLSYPISHCDLWKVALLLVLAVKIQFYLFLKSVLYFLTCILKNWKPPEKFPEYHNQYPYTIHLDSLLAIFYTNKTSPAPDMRLCYILQAGFKLSGSREPPCFSLPSTGTITMLSCKMTPLFFLSFFLPFFLMLKLNPKPPAF